MGTGSLGPDKAHSPAANDKKAEGPAGEADKWSAWTCVVHLENVRAHATSLAIFSSAAVIALCMIAIQEAPFDGSLTISSEHLQRVLIAMTSSAR